MSTSNLPLYQQYIHMSRYSRWNDKEKRRETWPETVERYLTFFTEHLLERHNYEIPSSLKEELRSAIINLEVMPSMRAMWAAGPALKRDEIAGYNCAYIPVNRTTAFDEILYLLMNGTGVGFSVERQYIAELPVIAEDFHKSNITIVVEDNKTGWAKALKEIIHLLYAGQIPSWDVSKLRPAGAILKTFGGRSSGPDPLVGLFRFVINMFRNAAGRRLNSLECHDLVCKIADVVIVGGVRRSALISLSNLSDDRMRYAKSGNWWETNKQRELANNSAAYTEKPDIGIFMKEWLSLYESKSGERGIFNRQAARKKVSHHGRRNPDFEFGVNPCVTGETLVSTSLGIRKVSQLIGVPFNAIIGGSNFACEGFWYTGNKNVFEVTTSHGYSFKATANHQVPSNGNLVAVEDLRVGDKLMISNNRRDINVDPNKFNTGWIIGETIGDGCHNPEKYNSLVRFWGPTAEYMSNVAFDIINSIETTYHQPVVPLRPQYNKHNNTYQVQSKKITDLCVNYIDSDKTLLGVDYDISILAGIVGGLFDADGSICGSTLTSGIQLQLSNNNLQNIKNVQVILNHFGIVSRIRYLTSGDQYKTLPDGHGNSKEYYCAAQYRLDIGRDNVDLFAKYVGFKDPLKKAKLEQLISSKIKRSYRTDFSTTITNIVEVGCEDVYDCRVEGIHLFDANGITVHNCGEIILRPNEFCNLSEVVVRENDTPDSLKRKVRLATILGTFQSTLTNFKYISKKWQKNCEEERLLGVSLTGIMDNTLTSGRQGLDKLAVVLTDLREYTVEVNKEFAAALGINPSVAITTQKPSGCTTLDTVVKTTNGVRSMADIFAKNTDDLFDVPPGTWIKPVENITVYDCNNEEKKVTNLFINGISEVYVVEDEKGNVYKFTPEHKLLTSSGWKRVDQISIDDEIMSF